MINHVQERSRYLLYHHHLCWKVQTSLRYISPPDTLEMLMRMWTMRSLPGPSKNCRMVAQILYVHIFPFIHVSPQKCCKLFFPQAHHGIPVILPGDPAKSAENVLTRSRLQRQNRCRSAPAVQCARWARCWGCWVWRKTARLWCCRGCRVGQRGRFGPPREDEEKGPSPSPPWWRAHNGCR